MPKSRDVKTPLPEERPRGGRMLAPTDFMITLADEVERAWRYDRVLSVGVGMIDRMDRPAGARFGAVEVESAVIERLRAGLRAPDRLAAFGSGEIAVLLPEANLRHAHGALARICADISGTPFEIEGAVFDASLSLGTASLDHRVRTPHRLLVAARQEWRRAVAGGGNRVCAATPERTSTRHYRSAELH